MANLTKREATRVLETNGASFLANVISLYHADAARKLRGAAELVEAGHDVRCAPGAMDLLWVDGYCAPWSVLTDRAEREEWLRARAADDLAL